MLFERSDISPHSQPGTRPWVRIVGETIGGCLDFVRRKGIVHRDIKPANILFHFDGTPIPSDFGVATQVADDSNLTLDGKTFGSPYYLSPEQAQSKPLDGRSDLYGLGIVPFEMLTGRKPYAGASAMDTIVAHLTAPIPRLPPPVQRYQDLLERMIAKSPEERFAAAAEMVARVRELRRSATARASSGTAHLRRFSPASWAVVAAAVSRPHWACSS